MDGYERLREAYARGAISLEDFERHVDGLLSERPYALPVELLALVPANDAPGSIHFYRPA